MTGPEKHRVYSHRSASVEVTRETRGIATAAPVLKSPEKQRVYSHSSASVEVSGMTGPEKHVVQPQQCQC